MSILLPLSLSLLCESMRKNPAMSAPYAQFSPSNLEVLFHPFHLLSLYPHQYTRPL